MIIFYNRENYQIQCILRTYFCSSLAYLVCMLGNLDIALRMVSMLLFLSSKFISNLPRFHKVLNTKEYRTGQNSVKIIQHPLIGGKNGL